MAAESLPTAQAAGSPEPRHGLRIFAVWIVVAVVADVLLWFVLGPHLPPGTMSTSAREEQGAIKLMSVMSAPVLALVLIYFVYSLIVWRAREGDEEDGPAIHGNSRVQTIWIAGTSVVVLGLAVFGTVSLIGSDGAGSGQGPGAIWGPPGAVLTASAQETPWTTSSKSPLVVQVIAQQWRFVYRYPGLGGFETNDLVLPEGTWVQFNVTSLDVIHSFWAYQLGVKADANPNVNNIAYTKPEQLGNFTVRCAELCGLWHGAMFDYGKVVTPAQFTQWASATKAFMADVTGLLPPYATTYDPTVIPAFKSGPVMTKLGITSAGGGYYPPQDPVQP